MLPDRMGWFLLSIFFSWALCPRLAPKCPFQSLLRPAVVGKVWLIDFGGLEDADIDEMRVVGGEDYG